MVSRRMIIRDTPPEIYSPEFKSIPKPVITPLANGINCFSYNMGSQPVFKLEFIFRIGSANIANPTVASMACNMLREGTQKTSAEEINNRLDFYGSHLDIKSGLDYTILSLYGRAEFLSELLPVVSEILKEPDFSHDALEKQKKLAMQHLQISQKKTSYWSTRLLRSSMFGENHAYSRIPIGDDIESIEVESLHEFHGQLLSNFDTVLIAGSFRQNEFQSLLQEYFGDIQLKRVRHETRPPIYEVDNATKELLNTTQASIALGGPAVDNHHEDYPLHSLVLKLFGGYFGSRLMKTLREDRGLTYGVHAYFVQLRQGNYLQISADVKHEAANESIEIIKDEISRLLREPVPIDELGTVKQYMLGEYINDSNTAFDFAGLYKKILLQDLSENYFDDFYKRVAQSSIEEVESIKTRVIDPNSIATVIVS